MRFYTLQRRLILLIFTFFYNNAVKCLRRVPDEQFLISRLLNDYDPASRPVFNASHTVEDEKDQILTTNVWLEQEWIDERLSWNQTEGNNLDKLRIPCDRLWLPDIVLYNSADDYTQGYMKSKAMVEPSGRVFWPPPAKLRSTCKIDVTYFPFDDQICHFKFGSWIYSGLQVNLVNKSYKADLSNYMESGEWELKGITVERNVRTYPCCPDEFFPDVVFYIYIRRRILFYLINIIFPCVLLSIISVMTFWLPPDSGEKITLSITVLLAYSVFMLRIAEIIPATSEMVPLIGIYLTITMTLTSMSIVLTVFVLQLHHTTQYSPRIPIRMYRVFTRVIACMIGMQNVVGRFERLQKTIESNSCRLAAAASLLDLSSENENEYEEEKETCYQFSELNISGLAKCDSESSQILDSLRSFNASNYSKLNMNNEGGHDSMSPKDQQLRPCGSRQVKRRRKSKSLKICIERLEKLEKFNPPSSNDDNDDDKKNIIKNEWKLIALIVDRVLFWVFSVLILVSSVAILFVVPLLKNANIIKALNRFEDKV